MCLNLALTPIRRALPYEGTSHREASLHAVMTGDTRSKCKTSWSFWGEGAARNLLLNLSVYSLSAFVYFLSVISLSISITEGDFVVCIGNFAPSLS
jgi:hypothetical protein